MASLRLFRRPVGGRGRLLEKWFVVEKEGAELNTESFYCASDKKEQDASQWLTEISR